jgi:hypothetical protein
MIHLLVAGWCVYAAIRWGDLKHWKQYHATMLYMSLINALYESFFENQLLWEYHSSLVTSHSTISLLYNLIVFPATVLIYLSNYPETRKSIVLHNLKWIGIYLGVEGFGCLMGAITYKFGWHFIWSVFMVESNNLSYLALKYLKLAIKERNKLLSGCHLIERIPLSMRL